MERSAPGFSLPPIGNTTTSDESGMKPETGSDRTGGSEEEVLLCREEAASRLEESRIFAKLGTYAGPVILIHLLLFYWVVSAATGFQVPAWLKSDRLAAWLWVNGGLVGLAFWAWRNRRFPVGVRTWATGRRARRLAIAWVGVSLFWFLLPTLLSDAWASVSAQLSGW